MECTSSISPSISTHDILALLVCYLICAVSCQSNALKSSNTLMGRNEGIPVL